VIEVGKERREEEKGVPSTLYFKQIVQTPVSEFESVF
jgi:hypothetical protein